MLNRFLSIEDAMRILLTTDYYWPYKGGGVEVVVKELAERLAEKGHEVMVLTFII